MATRFNSKGKSRFGVAPLASGFDANQSPTLSIPPVGLEDTDRALFNLFNKEIPLTSKTKEGIKNVPVIFAAGEKWAMLQKGAPRDKNGTLIIPLVVIGRTNLTQSPNMDIAGRGINQQTGEIILRRRLDGSNRDYQGLVNKLFIKNQLNIAVGPNDDPTANQLVTNREIASEKGDPTVTRGGLLVPKKRHKNIWETIVVPAPQFYTATYDVVIWTQYIEQMNGIIEMLISSFLPQGNQWRIDTDKGYWFIATVDGNLYNSQNNFDDMSQEERMIKYQFSIKVPGYILASNTPGTPVPIKRYVSNPEVTFSVSTSDGEGVNDVPDPFLGADDPTLPHADSSTRTDHQRRDGKTRLYPGNNKVSSHDPALESLGRQEVSRYKQVVGIDDQGNPVLRNVKVRSVNKFTGETVISPNTNLDGINIIVTDD